MLVAAVLLAFLAGTPAPASPRPGSHVSRPAPSVWLARKPGPQGDPGPGVSLALARERAARIRQLRYDVALSVPASVGERIRGEETIRFRLVGAPAALALDFQQDSSALLALEVNGRGVPYRVADGHVILGANSLRPGENSVRIRFLAGDAALNRNPEFLYSLFVPARASLALPVFDQPDLKARFTLALELPADWLAVANAPEAGRTESSGRVTVRFRETQPISTYLFGFAAGRWRVETGERAGRTIRMFHRELDSAKVARNREAIFDLVARSTAYLERYTGIAYPFPKYDLVLVPSFQFGGMEHPGAILYNASGLLLDESATQNQVLGRASVIAHETAHMWFGDLVTMRWFNDVWMKEVFANFMAAKIVNPSFPQVDHELRFLLAHYPAAYAVDRSAGTHPIRQPLENLSEAGQLYGAIIYQKAPIVMRMLEQLVGEATFRRGVSEYLRAHAWSNADWRDLVATLDRLAPRRQLRAWSRVWVEEAGRPTLGVRMARAPSGALAGITIASSDPAGRGRLWTQPATVALAHGDAARPVAVFLDAPAVGVPGAVGRPAPAFVLPNGGGRAYGRVELPPEQRAALLQALPRLRPALLRGAAWLDAWEALMARQITGEQLLDAAMAALATEGDEQLTERILGYTADAYWHFLPAERRSALAEPLEALLWERLGAVAGPSRKAAFFAALRSVTVTPAGVERLRRIWAKDTLIAGLPLSEQDYTTLALELAVRRVPGSDSLLAAQQARIQDPDRQARLAFVRPALSPDPAVRSAWFQALREPANRRHEPWVLEGLAYLNHPLHQGESVRYIRPALELLQEVQRTGDIFFPGRWVAATLGGHTSPAAARVVEDFLAERPRYPVRLRQLVLQGADELLRASGSAAAPLRR